MTSPPIGLVCSDAAAANDAADVVRALALGRLTAPFTHELRNSLTGIRCYFDILQTLDLPPEIQSFLGEVHLGLDRITELAACWMDVARDGAATTFVNGELRRVAHLLEVGGLTRRTQLELVLDEAVVLVSAPPRELTAALLYAVTELLAESPSRIVVQTAAAPGLVSVSVRCEPPRSRPVAPEALARLSVMLGAPVLQEESTGTLVLTLEPCLSEVEA